MDYAEMNKALREAIAALEEAVGDGLGKVFCPTGPGGGVNPRCRRGRGFGVHGPGITDRTRPPKKPKAPKKPAATGGGSKTKTAKAAKSAMPKGSKMRVAPDGTTRFVWGKMGGYAGEKTIANTIKKMEGLGFTKATSSSSAAPDGNTVGSGTKYKHPDGHEFEHSSSYGVTAASNRYNMKLTLAKGSLDAPKAKPAAAAKPKAKPKAKPATSAKPKTKEEQFKDWDAKKSHDAAKADLKKALPKRKFKTSIDSGGAWKMTSKSVGAMEVVQGLEKSGWKLFVPDTGPQSNVNFFMAKAANLVNVFGEYSGGSTIYSANPEWAKFEWKPPT
jgi:hypothetical protein